MADQISGVVIVGDEPVSLDKVTLVSSGKATVELSQHPSVRERVDRSTRHLDQVLQSGRSIYGVTTGFGGSCGNRLEPDQSRELGNNLLQFHGCGTGRPLGIEETRAAMLCRVVNLVRGYSSVSWQLLEQMVAFLNAGITPVVPEQGSVGASGDLTPMSYIGATLAGQRDVFYADKRMSAAAALEATGLAPLQFSKKEALAIMNGTSVMTGIGVVAVARSRRVLDAACSGTALAVHGLAGHASHFHPSIFRAKPHPSQEQVASRLRALLQSRTAPPESKEPEALQDPYSLRCAPHAIGVLGDALEWITQWVEIEANGVSDNPLFDPETGELLFGGNFFGGHIALAMDALKVALASVADLADRQVALLVDPRFSRGLPAGLVVVDGEERNLHHGFKAVQIAASALAAEAARQATPATIFSRSTECHNQDKVSLGTIAARDAVALCEIVSRVVAIELMVSAQACEIRGQLDTRPALAEVASAVRGVVRPLVEDRPMDRDIEQLSEKILSGTFAAGLR